MKQVHIAPTPIEYKEDIEETKKNTGTIGSQNIKAYAEKKSIRLARQVKINRTKVLS